MGTTAEMLLAGLMESMTKMNEAMKMMAEQKNVGKGAYGGGRVLDTQGVRRVGH